MGQSNTLSFYFGLDKSVSITPMFANWGFLCSPRARKRVLLFALTSPGE
jgi:hypothetical protein